MTRHGPGSNTAGYSRCSRCLTHLYETLKYLWEKCTMCFGKYSHSKIYWRWEFPAHCGAKRPSCATSGFSFSKAPIELKKVSGSVASWGQRACGQLGFPAGHRGSVDVTPHGGHQGDPGKGSPNMAPKARPSSVPIKDGLGLRPLWRHWSPPHSCQPTGIHRWWW